MKYIKNKFLLSALALLVIIFFPKPAKAVVPPDFIFNIGSQIAQAFSVVVVFLSAVFITLYQFLKIKFATLRTHKGFWIGSISFIIIGSFAAAVFYTAHEQKVNYNKWLSWFQEAGQKDKSQKKDYFYDRIIITGKDNEGQDFSLLFEGSRQEMKEFLFGHTYSVSILYKDKLYKDFSVFNAASPLIQSNQFVKSFSNSSSIQLPEESYEFSFSLKDKDFTVKLKNLESDFLVKNSLDYIRYVSPGKAEITVDNNTFESGVMVDKVLSNDSAIPTLEGFDPKYTSHSIVFWDDRGRFYHIDNSEVYTPNIPYTSHTWILYKDEKGIIKKAYKTELTFSYDKKAVWNILLPDIGNTTASLESKRFINEERNRFDAIVQGKVRDETGEHTIFGYAFYDNKR